MSKQFQGVVRIGVKDGWRSRRPRQTILKIVKIRNRKLGPVEEYQRAFRLRGRVPVTLELEAVALTAVKES